MRILANIDNVAIDASFSSDNESTNYPPSNLVDSFLRKRWQPLTGTSNVITVTFTGSEMVDCFFFGYHNLDSIDIDLYLGTELVASASKASNIKASDCIYFGQSYECDSAQITVNLASGTMYLGGIALGEYFQMPVPESAHAEGNIDNSFVSESDHGQSLHNYVPGIEESPYSFRGKYSGSRLISLERTDWQSVRDHFYDVGIGGKVWVDFNEDDHDFKEPKYCKLASFGRTRKDGNFYGWQMTFQEVR